MQLIDWLRSIGQPGIDNAKLTKSDIAKRAQTIIGGEVTVANISGILEAALLKPYYGQLTGGAMLVTRVHEITERLDRLEEACKAAGVEISQT